MVLRACPFIVNLPIPAIQAEGEVKTVIRSLARKIIERGPTESGKNRKNLLSTLGTYLHPPICLSSC
jgi:hypothetical protein